MKVQGTTPSGFIYEIDEGIKDDIRVYHLIKKLIRMEGLTEEEVNPTDMFIYDDLMERILGTKQYDKYCDFQPKTSVMYSDLVYIIENVNALKN